MWDILCDTETLWGGDPLQPDAQRGDTPTPIWPSHKAIQSLWPYFLEIRDARHEGDRKGRQKNPESKLDLNPTSPGSYQQLWTLIILIST